MENIEQTKVYLGIGSNIGDRLLFINRAIEAISQLDHCRLLQVAPIFETNAMGYTEQADFLNTVLEIETEWEPHELLQKTQAIEQDLGRVRKIHWGPRTIDVDILFWGDLCLRSDLLTIPHPLLHQRLFVLAPMYEIAKDYVHPGLGKTIAELYFELPKDGCCCKKLNEWEYMNEDWKYNN